MVNLIGFGNADNADGNLDAGISAVATQCTLGSGEGADFPTTINGTATSGGTATTLNSTGIQAAGVAVGDVIKNITDGSEAVVSAVATNSVTTTPLQGGSGNTWDNADVWAVGSFVVTVIQYNTTDTPSSGINKREKILVNYRSSDILYFNASGRGYDGGSGQSFDANDNVYLFVKDLEYQGLLDGIVDNLIRVVAIENVQPNYIQKDGSVEFDNNVAVTARDNADATDVDLFKLTTGDVLEFQTLPRNPSTRSISNNYDIIDKKYFDDNSSDTFSVTYGETIAIGEVLYFKLSDSKWYKADADDTAKVRARAVAVEAGNADDSKLVRKGGVATGLTGLTAGTQYYLSDTAGAVSATPSTTTVVPVGIALSTTTLLLTWGKKVASGVGATQISTTTETITTGFRVEHLIFMGRAWARGDLYEEGEVHIVAGVIGYGMVSRDTGTGELTSVSTLPFNATDATETVSLTVNNFTDTGFDIVSTFANRSDATTDRLKWVAIGE
jgi:hypothetical protein